MSMENEKSEFRKQFHDALVSIRHSVEKLHERLGIDPGFDLGTFIKVIDSKLLTRLDPDYPLMVAITGGGSTGKSSLFNSIVGKELSAVKAKAGLSRRVLVAIHPDVVEKPGFLESLFAAFGVVPKKMDSVDQLITPGYPVYVTCDSLPPNLVLLDTPDFDTGDGVNYANRHTAKSVLEASDVFLYIFTNATYNNLANTTFIREMLTDIGDRRAMMIYRCSRALTEEEIREHSEVVLKNIYGDDRDKLSLGVYRVDEDDKVVGGEAFMQVVPLSGQPEIQRVLGDLDAVETRDSLIASALSDIKRDARAALDISERTRAELELYRDAVEVTLEWAVLQVLTVFPKVALLKRFVEIWNETESTGIKLLKVPRKCFTGITKGVVKLVKNPKSVFSRKEKSDKEASSEEDAFKKNLLEVVNKLHNKFDVDKLIVEVHKKDKDSKGRRMVDRVKRIQKYAGKRSPSDLPSVESIKKSWVNVRVPRPSIIDCEEPSESDYSWEKTLKKIELDADGWGAVTAEIDKQLYNIVADLRREMNWKEKAGELFSASIDIVLSAGAIAYVIMTPAVAAATAVASGGGVIAQLTGVLGVNDLFALIVIPSSAGISHLDSKSLARILGPTFLVWYEEKEDLVRSSLKNHVAGDLIAEIDNLLEKSAKPCEELNSALNTIEIRG